MSDISEYEIQKERYLHEPGDESCYEYLQMCYNKISKDLGDYTAFATPIADQLSETPMSKLFNDVERLAAYISSKGYKKGDVITVFLPSTGHALTITYALNKLGIIANFVHPLIPQKSLLKNMKITNSKGLFILDIMCAAFAEAMEMYPTIVCSLSDYCDGVALKYALYNEANNAKVPELSTITRFKDAINNNLPDVATVEHNGKEPAIYMHGGGTTGRSKTVILSSYAFNWVCYAYYLLDRPHDYKNSYSICTLPCFHAYGLGGAMMYALCNAYKPIIFTKFDARQANEIIRKKKVTEILSVPKTFEKMMAEDNFENEGTKNLMFAFVGGDFVSQDFVESFDKIMIKHGALARMGRGFGLTEMCAACTSNDFSHYDTTACGYPLPGVDLEIWDEDGKKLARNEIGEIVVSGPNIMLGYLPDGYVTDNGIYVDENGKKWIKTGDMGYLNDGGFLVFSGRKKKIIIISGYNIYPATIDEKVATLDFINEVSAVQGYDDVTGKPLVKLCVSLKDPTMSHEKAIEELKLFCKENIAGYACPRKFVIMDALPRTKMEKIDFLKLCDEAK